MVDVNQLWERDHRSVLYKLMKIKLFYICVQVKADTEKALKTQYFCFLSSFELQISDARRLKFNI